MAVIEVSELSYTYPDSHVPALQDISLNVETGQLVAVIGANGAGKSTLSLALAGFIPALYHGQIQGSVRVCGLDTRENSAGQFAGRVGLMLQNPVNQLSGMRSTVEEEVAFGLENLGVPRGDMPGRIDKALGLVGLTDMLSRSPFALSGGQQQRLALASILALEPQLLILDEPTAMLDPQGTKEIFAIVHNMVQMGKSVIITGHQLEWMANFADRVIVLSQGRIILDGAADTVMNSPLLVNNGIGWLRYTRAAEQGRRQGLWPLDRVLPVTLQQAVQGFKYADKG